MCNKYADKKPEPALVLTIAEEKELVNWIFHCYNSFAKIQFTSVQGICKYLKKLNPFTDNILGRSWYESFLKRHLEISTRISKNVHLNRAEVTEQV